MKTYWIVNMKRKTYVPVINESFEGEWKNNYHHTVNASWEDVQAFRISDFDMANGIPFIYDLCCDGGLFTLLVDNDKKTHADVVTAKAAVRRNRDVVSLRVLRLTLFVPCEMCGNNTLGQPQCPVCKYWVMPDKCDCPLPLKDGYGDHEELIEECDPDKCTPDGCPLSCEHCGAPTYGKCEVVYPNPCSVGYVYRQMFPDNDNLAMGA